MSEWNPVNPISRLMCWRNPQSVSKAHDLPRLTEMSETANKPFRVVVVGAGVTGLAASHGLQKAGIDHVVLEKGSDAAPSLGTSIAIYPHGSRLLEQFGCLKAAEATTAPYKRYVNRMPNGKIVANNDLWKVVREK